MTATNPQIRFDKLKISLKYYLLSKNYMNALRAFTLAKKYHSGMRKDGVTPEFQHQLDICHYLLTLKWIENEEDVLCAALLHDIREDYEIENSEILNTFWANVAIAVECLTKKFKGDSKSYKNYFSQIANNPIASLVKGVDRINNINSMIWVFTSEKQLDYVRLVSQYFLPMLKEARENFPEQTYAYQNIETILRQLSRFVNEMNTSKE